jgi:hypothetical protein
MGQWRREAVVVSDPAIRSSAMHSQFAPEHDARLAGLQTEPPHTAGEDDDFDLGLTYDADDRLLLQQQQQGGGL